MGPAVGAGQVFPGAVLELLAAGGDRVVFEHGPRTVTAAELLATVRRIGAGLRAAGVRPGDGLAMVLGVSPEAYAAMIAAHAVGARVAGIRPGLPDEQLRGLLARDIAAVVVDPGTATASLRASIATAWAAPRDAAWAAPRDGARDAARAAPRDAAWAAPDRAPARPVPAPVPAGRDTAHGPRAVLSVGAVDGLPDLCDTPDDGAPPVSAGRPEHTARIIYTSGSTGEPKGCVQTYAALSAGWAAAPERWPPAIRELASRLRRCLVFGSLSSQVMMEYGTLTLAAGGILVVAERPEFPEVFARYAATASVITVPRLHAMVRAQRSRPVDLSSLRALMVSGSPLAPARLAEALAVLGPVVFHGYGQTETGMISMLTPAETAGSLARLASVGRPPAAVEVEVRGPDGRRLPAGVDGELYVRTPGQASGYTAATAGTAELDEAGTAEVFVDGWVRTRDLGRLDADGYLHLVGRVRDVVIVNAVLYHTTVIERVLTECPGVAEAYVVAAPDDATGEAAHAFVVPTPGATPRAAQLCAAVRERLGEACVPRSVTAIAMVPVAPSGKPDKRALAARVAGGPAGDAGRPVGDTGGPAGGGRPTSEGEMAPVPT